MKLTKKLEAEILEVYKTYWDAFLKGDIRSIASLVDDNCHVIGSSVGEVFNDKRSLLKYLKATIGQIKEKAELRSRKISVTAEGKDIMVNDQSDLYILINDTWTFYGHGRASTLFSKKANKWKIIHLHRSLPDSKAEDGEQVNTEKIKAENIQLRDAVKRRTIELEHKNHELEIEAALEKVRAVAMAMRKADDLMLISEVIFKQLLVLGFTSVRNVQIAIDDDEKQLYNGVEYSEYYQNRLVEVPYDSSPMFREIVNELKKSNNAFYQKEISGKEFKDWRKWRMSIDTKNHPDIASATSMFFYLHSVGAGMLGISTFNAITNDQLEILKRLRNVFELFYRRYIDIEKAEAQAREAQIELALERVRARTMAMQKSDELQDAAILLFQQIRSLGVQTGSCGFNIWNEKEKTAKVWMSSAEGGLQDPFDMPLSESPIYRPVDAAMKKGDEFLVEEVDGKNLAKHFDYLLTLPGIGDTIKHLRKTGYVFPKRMIYHFAFFNSGYLSFHTHKSYPEAHDIFKRFAKVFEQTYTRFRDLQKAEAQAREAQIELGLERVRARAMAMQKSDELSELVDTVFKELTKLDFALTWCIINIIDEPSLSNTVWAANPDITKAPESYHMLFEDYPFHHAMMKGWKERNTKSVYILEGDEKRIYDDYLFSETEFKRTPEAAQAASRAMEKYVVSFSFSNFGGLQTVGDVPLSDANLDILSRFGKVFDLTYTRFNDLKQAEAQARESQIQLALERVRARTMAMQKSDELREAVLVIYEQLQQLDFESKACNIIIIDKETGNSQYWVSGFSQEIYPESYYVPRLDHPYYEALLKPWRQGDKYVVYEYSGKMKQSFDEIFFVQTEFRNVPDEAKKVMIGLESVKLSTAFINYGALQALGTKPLSEENANILQRFAKVFEQTYTRFLDLQKSEAQARESQIQLALERVRARTMAMQHSDELKEAAALLFQQVKSLGAPAYSCGYNIWEKDDKEFTSWMSTQDGSIINGVPNIPLTEDANFIRYVESKQNGEQFFVLELRGERMQEHYGYLKTIPAFKAYFDYAVSVGFDLPETQIHHLANFSNGNLLFITLEPCPEFHDVFKRFAAVFEQTYTRFLDLQKAEAQARESQIQLALERVRARTMAMQKSDELPETSFLLFQQVKELGETTVQNSIGIVNDEAGFVELSTTVQGHHLPHTLHVPIDDPYVMAKAVAAWKAKRRSLKLEFTGQELKNYNEHRNSFFETKVDFPEDQWNVNIIFFSKGWLSFSSNKNISDETFDLLKRFAAVFEQTYTRFNDLKQAEAQAREAQIEAALEKVRSRSMGMQKSEELKEVIQVVYEQFGHLNIHVEHTGFIMDYKERIDMHIWLADKHAVPFQVTIPYFDCAHWNSFNEAKEKGLDFFANKLSFEEKNKFYQDLFKLIPGLPEETLEYYFSCPGLAISTVLLENVGLYIENFSGIPYSEEENKTLMRFGKVFQQTYTRFLDLQKAEAQAREAKIEAVLERIRSRTMAMQKSDELTDVAGLLFKQVTDIGIKTWTAGFNVWSEDNNSYVDYITSPNGGFIEPYTVYTDTAEALTDISNARKSGVEFDVQYVEGEKIKQLYLALTKLDEKQYEIMLQDGIRFPSHQYEHFVFGSKVSLMFITYEPVP